jgi:hypothetical protein
MKISIEDIEWLEKVIADNIVCWNHNDMSIERGNELLHNVGNMLREYRNLTND